MHNFRKSTEVSFISFMNLLQSGVLALSLATSKPVSKVSGESN